MTVGLLFLCTQASCLQGRPDVARTSLLERMETRSRSRAAAVRAMGMAAATTAPPGRNQLYNFPVEEVDRKIYPPDTVYDIFQVWFSPS